jgi:hypothetical protein
MTYITFQTTDTAQIDNILAYAKREKLQYKISESEVKYNQEFVAKIKESLEQEKNGQTVKIKIEDLWK